MSFLKRLFAGSATPTARTQPTSSQTNSSEWKALSDTFHDAAESGDLDKVKAMLNDHPGLVFSRIVNFGDTPLHAAASHGHKHMVQLLLAKGADVNVVDQNGQTPLHDTAGSGHTDVVELLLAKGANVNAKMHYDSTPLHMAASHGHKAVAELLLGKGANVNAKNEGGKTPLHEAARKGHKDVVESLRKRGGRE
jgi:ankyrin repeat protein